MVLVLELVLGLVLVLVIVLVLVLVHPGKHRELVPAVVQPSVPGEA
jgi:hypothetical protein